MKTKIIILTASLLIAAVSVSAYNFWQDKSVAKISFPLGNVLVLKKGEKKMQKASFNQNLYTFVKTIEGPQNTPSSRVTPL